MVWKKEWKKIKIVEKKVGVNKKSHQKVGKKILELLLLLSLV